MRRISLLHIVILLLLYPALAQEKSSEERFSHIDAHVSSVNKQLIFHPQLLAKKLSENLSNDYDKVRSIYVWIAQNISYDLHAYLHDRESGQSVNEVLRSGKALCTGFSLLFNFLCEQNNIESRIIDGYAKGYGYRKGQNFPEPNHSWNAVNIYGRWYLLDATWAISTVIDLSKHKKVIDFDTYFLTNPEKFIRTHLPEDPSWQLLEKKISLSDFETDNYIGSSGYSFSNYSPTDYRNINDYEADIIRYKRALEFNPGNESFNALLSFAYLYKGISLTDELWKMNYNVLMDTVSDLESTFYAYMDSSWIVIKDIDNKYIPYTRKIMEEEINYQKGVINYELGAELFIKANKSKIQSQKYHQITEKFFSIAEEHFSHVTPSSIYHRDALEYISHIKDFRSRKGPN